MLALLTTRCHEGCSHCMHDARPDGYDMTEETLRDVIVFMMSVQPRLIQLSGGEATLHPHFADFVQKVAEVFKETYIIVESNGSFVLDKERREQVAHVLRIPNVHMQVRTHKLYYPNYKRTMKMAALRMLPKTRLYHDAIRIFPIGRAAKMKAELKYRTCVNTFLLHKQRPGLIVAQIARYMQENGRFCSPMIDPNGILHAGESIFCTELGHVSNPKSMFDVAPCGKCGLQGVSL